MFQATGVIIKNKEILAKDGNIYYVTIKQNVFTRLPTRYDCMIYKKGLLFKKMCHTQYISYLSNFDLDRILEISFDNYLEEMK